MRIRIIANNPPEDTCLPCSDISKYIGQEFEAIIDVDNIVAIKLMDENNSLLDVYEGEYEIVEEYK